MSEYSAKNYTEQGGEKTVIGGEIVIKGKMTVAEGAETTGLPQPETVTVPVAENQTASTATDVAGVVSDLTTLLGKLKAAGLMAADEAEQPGGSEQIAT